MKEIKFEIQGSASEPYEVVFVRRDNGNLFAYCSCPAGENGQYCKHRINILTGNMEGIVSPNREAVKVVASWLPGTDLEVALKRVLALEIEEARLKRELSAAKKELAKSMRD